LVGSKCVMTAAQIRFISRMMGRMRNAFYNV
jgi:hypothetical protein